MLDTKELNEILAKLEKIEERDEKLAIELLKTFNETSKRLGKLLLNLDASLKHEDWKAECGRVQKELDLVVMKIKDF